MAEPTLLDLLTPWLPQQRWFPVKGQQFQLREVGLVRLDAGDVRDASGGHAVVEHRLLAVTTAGGNQVVQVPVVLHPGGVADGSPGVIGELDGQTVVDGPHDPAYVRALLRLIGSGERAEGSCSAAGHATGFLPHDENAPAAVLTGEQSNTSVIVSSAPAPLMLKLFRVITTGPNPDVEVTSALTEAGVGSVARVAGWLDGAWTDPDGEPASGHLAVTAEFLAGSQDAWREALAAIGSGEDFTAQAHALGAATAEVHAALAESLGAHPATPEAVADLVTQLRGRVEWALREVPALAELAEPLRTHSAALGELTPTDVGALQRVHGDYHLGQVLHSPARGWVLLDFEGEPLRPLADRIRPDVPARDVVGMVRSFDYAAGFVTKQQPERAEDARQWATACQQAFAAGYTASIGSRGPNRADGPLFDALLLDKALYEVVYEARNRPDWIDIPLAAVRAVLKR